MLRQGIEAAAEASRRRFLAIEAVRASMVGINKPKLWSFVIKPGVGLRRATCAPGPSTAVVFPAPRNPPIMMYLALAMLVSVVTALNHSIYCGVQKRYVGHLRRSLRGPGVSDFMRASFAIGFRVEQCYAAPGQGWLLFGRRPSATPSTASLTALKPLSSDRFAYRLPGRPWRQVLNSTTSPSIRLATW